MEVALGHVVGVPHFEFLPVLGSEFLDGEALLDEEDSAVEAIEEKFLLFVLVLDDFILSLSRVQCTCSPSLFMHSIGEVSLLSVFRLERRSKDLLSRMGLFSFLRSFSFLTKLPKTIEPSLILLLLFSE
jgi:hypothetical protein